MDTEQPTEEQRKAYLHNIGSTVSSFLEPLGIKVDVDVLGGEKSAEKKPDGESTTTGQSTSSGGATVSVLIALKHLILLLSCE